MSYILVDDDVEDRVDKAVEVGENHNVPYPDTFDFFATAFHHEEDGIGPPADQESGSDDPHDNRDPSEVLVILPKIHCLNENA